MPSNKPAKPVKKKSAEPVKRSAKAKKRSTEKLEKEARVRKVFVALMILAAMAASFAAGYFAGHSKATLSQHRATGILLVNERHTLSPDYVPDALVNLFEMRHSFRLASSDIYLSYECYEAAQDMFAAAEAENVNGFIITSGYRSYKRQAEVFAESKDGYAQKPGCSEHQTGLCFDVTAENVNGFETTSQYKWLRANAHKYGFIQRYPANKASVTGISYEPWHYRYVGVEAATYIRNNNITLEEYLGEN